ncbi:MAG: hypothetical protein MR823_07475, partial [Ruminococcus sp.]|nr:hypothetical protein [Ruminococcus sp.]
MILYEFIKIPQSFLFQKNDSSLYKGAFDGRPQVAPTVAYIFSFDKTRLPLTGNVCDRRLWRIKGASVGAAVDFVRRSKPHKQNRDTARGQ